MSARPVPERGRRTRRGARAASLLCVVGGLLLAAASGGDWAVTDTARTVAGVEVTDRVAVPGSRVAPTGLPLGVAATLGGIGIALLRGRARIVVGVVAALGGVAGVVSAAAGWWQAAQLDASVTAAPALAAVGAMAVLAGGVQAAVSPRPPAALSARYDIDRAPEDDEWDLASSPDDDERP